MTRSLEDVIPTRRKRKGHRFWKQTLVHLPLYLDNNDSLLHLFARPWLSVCTPLNLEVLLQSDKPFVTSTMCGEMTDADFQIGFLAPFQWVRELSERFLLRKRIKHYFPLRQFPRKQKWEEPWAGVFVVYIFSIKQNLPGFSSVLFRNGKKGFI